VELKPKFKPACKKIWKAFNGWRKRSMWFRVTVLLIIFSVPLYERLSTKNHVPLINELVWTACRAIRAGSEPKVTSAHLRYFHAQKSRQLQKQLLAEYNAGRLSLNVNELKLLSQNTLKTNYNKLFVLAKRAKLIPANLSLSQTKRAMLDKSLKFTAKRYDLEWEDVKQQVMREHHFHPDVLRMKFKILWYAILGISPLAIIPVLPWFILCFTLGFWGAKSKSQVKFVLAATLAIIMTLVWMYLSAYKNSHWFGWFANYHWRLLGISVFLSIWAFIGTILGKRLYNYTLKYSKETKIFIFLLLISSVLLLIPEIFFKAYSTANYYWWIGNYLLFKSSSFMPYLITFGVGLSFYTLFLIFKTYAQKLDKNEWTQPIKYLIIILLIAKLIFSWYPLCK